MKENILNPNQFLVKFNRNLTWENSEGLNNISQVEITRIGDKNFVDNSEIMEIHAMGIKNPCNNNVIVLIYVENSDKLRDNKVEDIDAGDEIYIFHMGRKFDEIEANNFTANHMHNIIDIDLMEFNTHEAMATADITYQGKYPFGNKGDTFDNDTYSKILGAAAYVTEKTSAVRVPSKRKIMEVSPLGDDRNYTKDTVARHLAMEMFIKMKKAQEEDEEFSCFSNNYKGDNDDDNWYQERDYSVDNPGNNDGNNGDGDEDVDEEIDEVPMDETTEGRKSTNFQDIQGIKDMNKRRASLLRLEYNPAHNTKIETLAFGYEIEELMLRNGMSIYIDNAIDPDENAPQAMTLCNNLEGNIIGRLQNIKMQEGSCYPIYYIFGNNCGDADKLSKFIKIFDRFNTKQLVMHDEKMQEFNSNDSKVKSKKHKGVKNDYINQHQHINYCIKDLDLRIARCILCLSIDQIKKIGQMVAKKNKKAISLIQDYKDEIVKLSFYDSPASAEYLQHPWDNKTVLNTKMHRLIDLTKEIKNFKK